MKLLDISSALPRRAKKITTERLLYFLNELIRTDILVSVRQTFKDYFDASTTITMVDGTLDYAMPTDYESIKEITNESGQILFRGGNTVQDVSPKDRVRVYGGNVYVDADRSFSELRIEYYKIFPDFDESSDIDLPDDITKALKNVWVTGGAYFYFSENKKTQETQTSFAQYGDAKTGTFSFDTLSLV